MAQIYPVKRTMCWVKCFYAPKFKVMKKVIFNMMCKIIWTRMHVKLVWGTTLRSIPPTLEYKVELKKVSSFWENAGNGLFTWRHWSIIRNTRCCKTFLKNSITSIFSFMFLSKYLYDMIFLKFINHGADLIA